MYLYFSCFPRIGTRASATKHVKYGNDEGERRTRTEPKPFTLLLLNMAHGKV